MDNIHKFLDNDENVIEIIPDKVSNSDNIIIEEKEPEETEPFPSYKLFT